MAIVVKQASNTPLMLGQLAETLANTYLQHNQQKQQWDKYEQERIWKNEDRAQGQASYDSVMGADPSTFGGAVFQQNAATRAKAGNDISGYLPSTSTMPAHLFKNQQLNRYYDPNSGATDVERQTTDSQYSITQMKQDPMGLSQNAVDAARASTGGNPYTGSLSASGDWTAAETPLGQSAEMQSATMGAGALGSSQASPALPQNDAEFAALPSGAWYRDSEGVKQKR